MWVWLDSAGPILFDAALSTAIFLTLVVLAMLVCRQPTRRLLIARVAIVASLAMIPLVALVPLPRLDLLDTLLQSDLVPASLIGEFEEVPALSTDSDSPAHRAQSNFADNLHDWLLETHRWFPRGLTLIDLMCVGTGLAWLLLGFWGVQWLIRHSRAPSAATREIFDRLLAGDAPRQTRPALRVSSRVHHPVVVGFLKPTILLPSALDEPGGDPELLRLSLLHEIAHADRCDPWFGTMASLAQTLWFFLPQVWWVRSQLMMDQEFLADRSAARRYGTSSGYAASLLSLAGPRPALESRHTNLESTTTADGRSAIHSPLALRVLMLLYCPFRFEVCAPRSWSWALRITLGIATLIAACLCIRWPHASALEHRLKHGASHAAPSFRVTDFTAKPLVFSKGGRALSYVMPVALPSHFELTVEVFSRSADLGKVRIAGHPLGDTQITNDLSEIVDPSLVTAESWHRVRLKRVGPELSLWVDGRAIAVSLNAHDTSEWLTFEPDPGRATQFRSLAVEW
jgi:beta-lactamase regulating signal transducer with metallopeptidase domain